jgi:DNA-binding HxlR family transcriptional regulator
MGRKKEKREWRSGCPLNASVEMLGDRWSLLIIRDMMLREAKTFKDFLGGYEKIATNVLADRLKKLERFGVIRAERDAADGRKMNYALTEKGIDLAPVLTEMVLWAAAHEKTENPELVKMMRKNRKGFEAGIRRKWRVARRKDVQSERWKVKSKPKRSWRQRQNVEQ